MSLRVVILQGSLPPYVALRNLWHQVHREAHLRFLLASSLGTCMVSTECQCPALGMPCFGHAEGPEFKKVNFIKLFKECVGSQCLNTVPAVFSSVISLSN